MALRYEMPPAPTPIQLNLRVVSDHAQLLLDSLCIADRALTKLLASDQADNAEHLCADFYAAYARLKVHLLRKNDSATARNAEHADQHDRDDV